MIKNLIASLAICACFAVNGFAQFTEIPSGPAADGTVKAGYDPATGQVIVSVNNVLSWFIESSTSALTGSDPTLPTIGGALNTNNDARVGQSSFGAPLVYQNQNLSNIVAAGTPISDLVIKSAAAFGAPELTGTIELLIPEPATFAMLGMAALGLVAVRRRRA